MKNSLEPDQTPSPRSVSRVTPMAFAPSVDLPRMNVLIVDDEPSNLLALEAILEPLALNLVRAVSGKEALRHALR